MSHAARSGDRPRYRPDPADEEALLLHASEQSVALTADELSEWERTGELPASVDVRLAQCSASRT